MFAAGCQFNSNQPDASDGQTETISCQEFRPYVSDPGTVVGTVCHPMLGRIRMDHFRGAFLEKVSCPTHLNPHFFFSFLLFWVSLPLSFSDNDRKSFLS